MLPSRVGSLFGLRHPVVEGGMIWVGGWRLAAAVSRAGGLGMLGAGSMTPDVLDLHLARLREAVPNLPFAVNLPLLYPSNDEKIGVMERHGVSIVFTSAGSPKKHMERLRKAGMKVVHVVGSSNFAKKAEDAGCDAVVAEGFEAGGHNAREETTTMVLIPAVRKAVSIPVIAAGGIATGEQMAAAFALGADAVQVGTAFAACEESSAHPAFKERIRALSEGDTRLLMKKLVPVRLARNAFSDEVAAAEDRGATVEELAELLGKGRAKKAIFDGFLDEGEIEIGQAACLLGPPRTAAQVVEDLVSGCERTLKRLAST